MWDNIGTVHHADAACMMRKPRYMRCRHVMAALDHAALAA
jgi:hypothetical protein